VDTTKALDLGCGKKPRNDFNADEMFGIDIVDHGLPNIKMADLAIEPIPFDDNTFDIVTGYDFLEHIPVLIYNNGKRKYSFIDVMSEVWRVLKPGGRAYFCTPAYPNIEAFQDPTHVNFITTSTLQYFSFPSPTTNWWSQLEGCKEYYGFKGQYTVTEQKWKEEIPYHLVWDLKAVK
jgi:SAM-dependent methyltransferase